jgi:hypothetical protein
MPTRAAHESTVLVALADYPVYRTRTRTRTRTRRILAFSASKFSRCRAGVFIHVVERLQATPAAIVPAESTAGSGVQLGELRAQFGKNAIDHGANGRNAL